MKSLKNQELEFLRGITPHRVKTSNLQMDADKEYFKLHPNEREYYRNPYPSEFALFSIHAPTGYKLVKIKVTATDTEGLRIRQPIFEVRR